MTKPFRGTINLDDRDSVPDWEPYLQPVAPAGAPNVLYIVLDDVGFSAMEPWGGLIETPNISRLAENGLPNTNWTPTPPSSARRGALRCSPAATTRPTAWPASPRRRRASRIRTATFRSSARRFQRS